jgi:hypothetical protein
MVAVAGTSDGTKVEEGSTTASTAGWVEQADNNIKNSRNEIGNNIFIY